MRCRRGHGQSGAHRGDLFEDDVEGSRAWSEALLRAGVLSPDEQQALDRALTELREAAAADPVESLSQQVAEDMAVIAGPEGAPQTAEAMSAESAPDEAAAISVALWGIAETGSVVIHSAPDQPILGAMLPRHWLVVVEESRILPFLDDYAANAKPAPRNAVLITGSSGTTDIEGYFVRGAHGPGFVHVLLIAS